MLRKIQESELRAPGARFAVVASEYNNRYVGPMVEAALAELEKAGAAQIDLVRVPGAFETPVVAARLARRTRPARYVAVICLGVILRGETAHAEHIGRGVTDALVRLQIELGVPMIHEVLLLENEAQAKARCLDPERNRGREAAQAAIRMARVMASLAETEGRSGAIEA